jgi:hypothetical protein
MRTALASLAILTLFTIAVADSPKGLKPRATAADYPVFQQHIKLALGAEQLSQKQVQHAFATELDKRYIVVEVGVFPSKDGSLKLNAADFMLHVAGTSQVLRPAAPETIAQVLYKKPSTSHDVTITPVTSVGYESGGRDIYGNRQSGGMTTSSGAIVGVSSNKKGGTEGDRKTMETELRDKALPQGEVIQPVSGYLYFPVSTAKKVQYELEYSSNGQVVRLQLPSPKE